VTPAPQLCLALAFSPDSSRLAMGGLACVSFADVKTGKVDADAGHDAMLSSIAFAPDGRIVTAGLDETIRFWTPDGRADKRLDRAGRPRTIAFAGPRLVRATWRSVDVLDPESFAPLVAIPHDSADDVAVSPDASLLVTSSNSEGVRLFSAADGKLSRTLEPGEGAWFPTLAFSPDGKRVAGGSIDGIVRIWPTDGSRSTDLQDRKGGDGERDVTHVAWSPDGKSIATSGRDGSLTVRDASNGKELARLHGHAPKAAHVVLFSPDGKRLASAGEDGLVRLWDLDTSRMSRDFAGHDGPVRALAFSPDGTKLVSGGADGTAVVWQVAPEKPR
jgi:WD40 repeat protein